MPISLKQEIAMPIPLKQEIVMPIPLKEEIAMQKKRLPCLQKIAMPIPLKKDIGMPISLKEIAMLIPYIIIYCNWGIITWESSDFCRTASN